MTRLTPSNEPDTGKQKIINDIDRVLTGYFASQTKQAGRLHTRYAALLQSMSDLNKSGGKRMRPYLTVLAYRAYGGNSYSDICYVAAAQEMIHFAMLIHDDVIDRDFSRYGVANINGQYMRAYKALAKNGEDVAHYANSAAILAGDIAIAAAFELIAKSEFPAASRITATRLLSQAIFTVAGGELLDTDELFYETKLEDPLVTARLKTAYYSFTAPMLVGANLAGAPDSQCKLIEQAGEAAGTAFQLSDDLLGVFGNQAVTGKPVDSDIREGKRTYLYMLALSQGAQEQKKILANYYGKRDLTKTQANLVRKALKDSDAFLSVQQKIDQLTDRANGLIGKLHIQEPARQQLYELIYNATHRDF